MADCDLALLKKRLCDAEEALHEITLGRHLRVVVDHNGERVEYTAANRSALRLYIQELKDQIAVCEGGSKGGGPIVPYGVG